MKVGEDVCILVKRGRCRRMLLSSKFLLLFSRPSCAICPPLLLRKVKNPKFRSEQRGRGFFLFLKNKNLINLTKNNEDLHYCYEKQRLDEKGLAPRPEPCRPDVDIS